MDILVKRGNSVKLIEVKSKSYDSDKENEHRSEGKRTTFLTAKGTIDSEWEPYLVDLCYQSYVASLAHPELHEIPWLKKYVKYADGKKTLDPYKTLRQIEIAGKAESIQEGTGAMRAYQHMLYGQGRDADPESKKKWGQLLLQYCELDTIAMLVVWSYSEMKLGLRGFSMAKRHEHNKKESLHGHTVIS